MKSRKKTLMITGIVLVVAGLAAGLVLAQEAADATDATAATDVVENETIETEVVETTFLERVAANLGVDQEALAEAMELAHIQGIDEAVAAGRLTEEQAETMKGQIEARQAFRDVIDNAIASGELTEEQAELLQLRGLQGGMMGRIEGLRERLGEFREQMAEKMEGLRSQKSGGSVRFMVKTPRGTVGGRFCRP